MGTLGKGVIVEVWRSPLPRIHPASQQGGRGRLKPGWRSLGEDGGERISATLFDLASKLVCSQSLAGVIILKTLLFTCGLILEEVD